jgi:hypothetical protein
MKKPRKENPGGPVGRAAAPSRSAEEAVEGVSDLIRELRQLRARVDKTTEQFSLGVKARIDEIVHVLSQAGAPDAGHVLPEPPLVRKMVQRLRSHGRRPTRGRAKDLKRIHDLVSGLADALVRRE